MIAGNLFDEIYKNRNDKQTLIKIYAKITRLWLDDLLSDREEKELMEFINRYI